MHVKHIISEFANALTSVKRSKINYRDIATGDFVELWEVNGYADRENGPARIRRDRNGCLLSEAWCRGGGLHREGGPALINYNPANGEIVEQQWWKHAERLSFWEEQAAPHLSKHPM